jgi:D-aminoacyl-tRNA deacylase
MNFIIIASNKDEAGKNIFRHIHEDYPMLNHYLIPEDSIYAENIDKKFPSGNFFIFATKHASQQSRKTLSIHAPGNWNKADFGGQEGKICLTSAFFLKHLFQILNQEAKNSNYECTLEVTHHGPYLNKPCCFIEIGSSEEQWKDEEAGKIIARTIKKAIKTFNPNQKWKTAIGIGSPHYCPNFNKIQLNSELAISHIIPSYAFPITLEMLKEAVNKTQEKVEITILDWKGMKGEDRQETIKILNQLGLKYKRTSEVKEEDGNN